MSTSTPSEPRLTTTSFAILTQLALRPWSPYELAQQRVRYFRYTRPLTESAIYREMKRLDSMGLAESEKEYTGRRSRTTYEISELGLSRLREWLDTPVAPFAMEFEGMIRLFAAPIASEEQIVHALEQILANAREMLDFGRRVTQEFRDGRNPLQNQAYVRELVVDFRIDMFSMVAEWAERSIEHVRRWEGLSLEERNAQALRRIGDLLPSGYDPEPLTAPAVPPDLDAPA